MGIFDNNDNAGSVDWRTVPAQIQEKTNMKKLTVILYSLPLVIMDVSTATAAYIPSLQDWGFNVDGTSYYNGGTSLPGYFDTSAFDFLTGLGTVTATYYGSGGTHDIGALFDHDSNIDFLNEQGNQTGSVAAGLSWEIGSPDNGAGVIYTDFNSQSLTNAASPFGPDDVAMAINRQFSLGQDEFAILTFSVTNSQPLNGFYLAQTDLSLNDSIYFTNYLTIESAKPSPIPEPSTFALFSIGLGGFVFRYRKQRNNK